MTSSQLLINSEIRRSGLERAGTTRQTLRILTITPFYPSIADPTQGKFISEPIAQLRASGISNQTIAVQPFYRRPGYGSDTVETTWVPYFSVPGNLGLSTAGNFLAKRLLNSVVQRHSRQPFHLIHAHAALPCGHAAMLLSKQLSIPFVVSVHGLDAYFTRQAGILVRDRCRRVAEEVYSAAANVICISEKVRSQVAAGVRANTTVIYNGVDPEIFSPASSTDSPLSLVSVGNLIPTKGHAILLRAFAQAVKVVPDCKLEIIGNGPERNRLIRLASRLGVSGNVHFRGRQSTAYVVQAMRRCTAFVLPSTYEGLGCVYLEAMACAKPVIACYGQGIDEVIHHGKTGILVQPGDEIELRDAILMLLIDQDRRQKVGSSARDLVGQQFTVQRQAWLLRDIYQRCLA
ncbi:MAG TPA: glycosyltransferase [Terriglobales bacterium]|nr:glycosyltransferase [Terriglobales bacterium]